MKQHHYYAFELEIVSLDEKLVKHFVLKDQRVFPELLKGSPVPVDFEGYGHHMLAPDLVSTVHCYQTFRGKGGVKEFNPFLLSNLGLADFLEETGLQVVEKLIVEEVEFAKGSHDLCSVNCR